MTDQPPSPPPSPPPGQPPLQPQQPSAHQWQGPPLAEWPKRAQAAAIDWFGPAVVVAILNAILPLAIGMLLWLAALGWVLYNAWLQGERGQSIGKQQAGITLVSQETGRFIGGGMGIARYFVHILDSIPCYVGFLWPLWDPMRQTFADKIVKTVVVDGNPPAGS